MGERETERKERIEAERGRRPPLAGLSGAVRMMNGRPARAVRALMGAAELYITLLSVCERLLKALKSPGSDAGLLPATKTSSNCGDRRRRAPGAATKMEAVTQVRTCTARGEGGDGTQMDRLFSGE